MKHPFYASLLALCVLAPAAQARDNAILPAGVGSASLAYAYPGAGLSGLRISDGMHAHAPRIGPPALTLADAGEAALPPVHAAPVPGAHLAIGAAALKRPLTLRLAQAGSAGTSDALASLNARAGSSRLTAADRAQDISTQ